MIGLSSGTRIWIAAGVTDLRRGFLWFDGDGLRLFAKRLERGRFFLAAGNGQHGFADECAVVELPDLA
jgi:transposase